MFARNLLLILLFSERSLAAAALPILAMSVVAGLWIWKDNIRKELSGGEQPVSLHLESPIAIQKVISFGFLFIVVQIGGTLLTKVFGSYGILATGFFGGLVSSASTTAAAATMANHGKITAAVAGSVAVLSSLASTIVNLPIIWKTIEDKAIVKQLTLEIITILLAGIAVVALDRIFEVSEFLITMLYK